MSEKTLAAIKELWAWTINRAQVWDEVQRDYEPGSDMYLATALVQATYQDMVERMARLVELTEKEAAKWQEQEISNLHSS